MAIGHAGYMQHTADIMAVTRSIAQGVGKINGLKILGNAEAMIVCFTGMYDRLLSRRFYNMYY
jgi:hypothetical protein